MKTPQEKKRLSYAKDRRNTFGENNKASRKNIPRSKALSIRSERHAQDAELARAVASTNMDQVIDTELRVRAVRPRWWRKSADEPLGTVLSKKASDE
ncbi:MAG: hypothetical protein J0L58_14915 [Burkholderiales bacterium]|nr:hypothetical protein [Burkholderiales bacterium]